jgi:Flp pilus assembly pilin Flp
MRQLMLKLWKDECGAYILLEWLLLVLFLAIGIITGLTALRQAIITEAEETANAILALNQSFSFSGQINCQSSTAGSAASDFCDNIVITSVAAEVCNADANPCD